MKSDVDVMPNDPLRIFVVDDDRVIASTLGMVLRREGFDVVSFTDPVEALRAVPTKAPDLLITDVAMPSLSGIELAIKLRETCPECKVILLSGSTTTTQMLEDAKDKGHDFDATAKPIHPTELISAIRKLLSPSQALQCGLRTP